MRVSISGCALPRRQPFRCQARRRAHHQNARGAGLLEPRHCLAQVEKAGLQAGIEELARRGENDCAHAALKQLHAQQFFKAADLMADRAGADVQFGRRLGQAQVTRGSLESPQTVQGRQIMHEIISIID